jgi:hypothetical protein
MKFLIKSLVAGFALFIFSVPAFGGQGDTYVFNFKTDLGYSVFKLTDDEKQELANDVKADFAAAPAYMKQFGASDMTSYIYHTFKTDRPDALEQFGSYYKYHNVPSRLPMFGQNGTNWVLCCRMTSFPAIGLYQENLGHGVEYDYCLVSQEYLDASKENGHITLYGEDVPVSELRPVATLVTGMKEISWRNEIESEANNLNITNLADFQSRAQMQGRTFKSQNPTDWIHLADTRTNSIVLNINETEVQLAGNNVTTELARWLPAPQASAGNWVTATNPTKDTISFRAIQFGMINADTLSKIQDKNSASENDFVQFTNDIYQCAQLEKQDAELQKQAEAKPTEEQNQVVAQTQTTGQTQMVAQTEPEQPSQPIAQQKAKSDQPPFNLLFCVSAFFVGVSGLGFAWKDRATANPSLFNLKKISLALGLGLVPFAFYQNPLVGIGVPILCLILFLKNNGGVCPSCSRLVEAEPTAMILVDGHVKYRDVKRQEHVKNQRGETVFTIEKDETIPIEVKTHRHHYQCPICQHQWTKLKTTETKA